MGGVENNEENEIWSCKQWKGQPGICPKSLQSVGARGSLRGSFRDHRHVGMARLPGQVPPALLRIILPNSSKAFFKKNLLWKNLPKETAYTRISNSPFWKTIYFAFQDSFCNQLKNNLPVILFLNHYIFIIALFLSEINFFCSFLSSSRVSSILSVHSWKESAGCWSSRSDCRSNALYYLLQSVRLRALPQLAAPFANLVSYLNSIPDFLFP